MREDSSGDARPHSLRTIAEEVGVSRMTVSRILKGRGGHRKELVERVRQAARRLDYRINPHVAAAMEQVRRNQPAQYLETLAYLHENHEMLRFSTHGNRLSAGIEQRASELGYKIELHSYPQNAASGRSLRRMLRARGIRGLLLGSIGSRRVLRHLDLSGFACAANGPSIVDPPVSHVLGEAADRIRLALEHCERLGYQRPVLAVDRQSFLSTRQHFVEPLLYWYYQREIAGIDPLYLFEGRVELRPDFESFLEAQHPDVVLSPRRVVFDWLCARKVHHSLAFIHLNWNKQGSAGLAGVDQRSELQGAATVDLISARLHRSDFHPGPDPREVVIPPTWQAGGSLPPRLGENRRSRVKSRR